MNNVLQKYNNRVEGFTLLETLFVILLTTIVISLVFVYFNTFQKYTANSEKVIIYEKDILRFESLMQYDIDRSRELYFSDDDVILNDIDVSYKLTENMIIRDQSGSVDTLRAREIQFDVYYQSDEIPLVKGIEINLTDLNNHHRTYYFYRDNDFQSIFNTYLQQN
jgi:type II secretory pathway pseudopilin PulG